ncbi:hypothetical protein CBA19CS11_30920 [Caballeronia novacaledonica]|uniref:hypothetical protein n=1 Tax=Caballeronia novacaledonica TaxID=1544861 RepID=UPI001EE2F269|nr:hypothetical protein [Caballeronia novacaledonica]GJH13344.1 hypothetical protein CBA19CS11_30920 [Caballeronia novacaledonica]
MLSKLLIFVALIATGLAAEAQARKPESAGAFECAPRSKEGGLPLMAPFEKQGTSRGRRQVQSQLKSYALANNDLPEHRCGTRIETNDFLMHALDW